MESEKWNKSGLLKKYIRNSPMKWKMGFSMIPTQILMDERLSRSCLVVFWVLTVHIFRGKRFCFPSTATIAKEAHSSRPTVIKAIKELEQYGYLEVERSSGGREQILLEGSRLTTQKAKFKIATFPALPRSKNPAALESTGNSASQ